MNNLVESNLKLIYKVINDLGLHYKQEEYYDVGIIGLIKASRTYNNRDNFGVYAYTCIKNQILSEIRKESKYVDFRDTLSLDYEIGEDNFTLLDLIPDDTDLEKDVLTQDKYEKLYQCISKLKLKEQMVIKSYFGIKCSEKKLVDIAKELKTSKQVVSVIKKRALGKLKEYILKEKRKEIRK